eukprot:1939490-Pyramimonas_sp.AAC.2
MWVSVVKRSNFAVGTLRRSFSIQERGYYVLSPKTSANTVSVLSHSETYNGPSECYNHVTWNIALELLLDTLFTSAINHISSNDVLSHTKSTTPPYSSIPRFDGVSALSATPFQESQKLASLQVNWRRYARQESWGSSITVDEFAHDGFKQCL